MLIRELIEVCGGGIWFEDELGKNIIRYHDGMFGYWEEGNHTRRPLREIVVDAILDAAERVQAQRHEEIDCPAIDCYGTEEHPSNCEACGGTGKLFRLVLTVKVLT